MQESFQAFPQFPRLPAELRIKIWQETCPLPGIHIFDVCIPSSSVASRLHQAFQLRDGEIEDNIRVQKFQSSAFLDRIKTVQTVNRQTCSKESDLRFDSDPSAYQITRSVRQSCLEAFTALQTSLNSIGLHKRPVDVAKSSKNSADSNLVYLPGKDTWLSYDNTNDLLFLRFGPPVPSSMQENDSRAFNSGLSDILLCPWSSELAETIQNARRIAIDIAELSPVRDCSEDAIIYEVAYLSSCLQRGLEVLYVVDHCVGRCEKCGKNRLSMSDLQHKGVLVKQLNDDKDVIEGQPDVFHAKGATYHEIYALEKLGWGKDSWMFRILRMFAEAIREQQGEFRRFQGVRVLACQSPNGSSPTTRELI